MRKLMMLALVLGMTAPASAQIPPKIECLGTSSGGPGTVDCDALPRDYVYKVTAGDFKIAAIKIGTHDDDPSHYTERCTNGWYFHIDPTRYSGFDPDYSGKTPHGMVSTSDGHCPYTISFWKIVGSDPLDPNTSLTFGFNHDASPAHDVNWRMWEDKPSCGLMFQANWDSAVGLGYGPVHAPLGDPVGAIYGTKWYDQNGDGLRACNAPPVPNEPPLPGWTIALEGPVNLASTVQFAGAESDTHQVTFLTDAQGNYCFMNLAPGTYFVTEIQKPGWTSTYPPSGTHTVILGINEVISGLDFGNYYAPGCEELNVDCCGSKPAVAGYAGQMAVATNHADSAEEFVVGIVDLTGQCQQDEGLNWLANTYHNAMPNPTTNVNDVWNVDNLGDVFGLTLDTEGNIYVTATAVYDGPSVFGPGGSGAVYKLDGANGAISTLASLPNQQVGDPAAWAGLGNITYDCERNRLYVSNFEDGAIYIIVLGPFPFWGPGFDHGIDGRPQQGESPLPDDATPGPTPLGRRVWAVEMFNDSRLYYSVWREDEGHVDIYAANEIWSVGFDQFGGFDPNSSRLEILLPPLLNGEWSNPVSDISFRPDGRMLVAERTMTSPFDPAIHRSRLLEFKCVSGAWQLHTEKYSPGAGFASPFLLVPGSAGGVDFDYATYAGGCQSRTWVTADNVRMNIYGLQGLPAADCIPPQYSFCGTLYNSLLIDLDSDVGSEDQAEIGDVEIPCPTCDCDCHADPQCDGQPDVFDIVHAVNVGFRNDPDIGDPNPNCPRNTTDVDCDGDTDVFDIVRFVNVAFRNEAPEDNFCDPCAP